MASTTPKILKLWHTWGWAAHLLVWLVMGTGITVTYANTIATDSKNIAELQKQHIEENMNTRMAIQETTSREINDRLSRMEAVQGKIFDRINQLADRR